MLSQQQYDKLLPHKTVMKFVAEGGGGHNFPMYVYDIAKEVGVYVDLTCNGCKINTITDLYNLLIEYENGKG